MKSPAVLLAATILVAGCSGPAIKGDGVIRSETRPISDFSALVVSGGYEIKWSGGRPALTITTDQNLLPLVNTSVSGTTLTIDSKESLAPTNGIRITVSSAALADVQLAGGNTFTAGGISGGNLKLGSTGASDITVHGSVENLEAGLTGASHLNAKALTAQNATLSLTGASNAAVNVTGQLRASVTGAGSVTYSGNPASVEQHVTGAGSVQRE
jgi:Putative auto-transporter adhesin, head GIN domain